MFCKKCGKEIPNDSVFCPKCGTQNVIEVSGKVDLEKDNAAKPVLQKARNAPAVQQEQHTCPNCGKPISDSWEHCAFCTAPNPYNKNSKPTTVINNVVPPPQVIVKEEKIIIQEQPKQQSQEDGCATYIGKAVIGFISFIFIMSLLGSCLSCAGCT